MSARLSRITQGRYGDEQLQIRGNLHASRRHSQYQWSSHRHAQLDVDVCPNPKEVCATKYVSRDSLATLLKEADNGSALVSPWFRLLCETVLPMWWDALEGGVLPALASKEIHRLLDPSAKAQMWSK